MVPARYTEVMREVSTKGGSTSGGKDKFWWRQKMVKYVQGHGISEAAREFGTTRKTVRLWFYRYLREGVKGFLDRSRAPHHIPHKTSKEVEQKVIELKRRYFTFSASRLKELFDLSLSCGAMYRIWREHKLIKKKRKYRRQRDLSQLKKRLRAFAVIQIDTKRLDDIEEFYPSYFRFKLPRWQFTARDVRTGGTWIAYAQEGGISQGVLFLKLLINHIRFCGVDLKKVMVQTDNGAEFIGSAAKKQPSEFVLLAQKHLGGHLRIPPGAKTYNSDVEAFHRRVEEEFYRIESISSRENFLSKAYAYMLWFNYQRKNRYKDNQNPAQILYSITNSNINKQIFNLPPLILDLE